MFNVKEVANIIVGLTIATKQFSVIALQLKYKTYDLLA